MLTTAFNSRSSQDPTAAEAGAAATAATKGAVATGPNKGRREVGRLGGRQWLWQKVLGNWKDQQKMSNIFPVSLLPVLHTLALTHTHTHTLARTLYSYTGKEQEFEQL